MPNRIALAAIGVTREGKTVYPPVGTETTGEPFNFTDEEIKQIEALEKSSDLKMLRKLRNETSSTTSAGGDNDSNDDTDEFSAMTVPQLKAAAAERNIDIGKSTTKAALLELLRAPVAPAAGTGDDEDL